MIKRTFLFLLLSATTTCFADESVDRNWETESIHIYSNASSYQFYATFVLIRDMLKEEWNEDLYQRLMHYQSMDLSGMSQYEKKFEDDKIWGAWFAKKLAFQNEVISQLNPLIEKKRKGQSLEKENLKLLKSLESQISETLLK